jgi:two-component system, chemotaxis family, chemotaxis protein CheY
LHPLKADALANLPENPHLRTERWLPVPPKDGACFVKYLRQSRYSPNPYISIIMVTGLGLQNNVEYARDAGVNEVILKPVSIETLCERITALIDDSRLFITASGYKGPCRRRKELPYAGEERRSHDIRLYKHDG